MIGSVVLHLVLEATGAVALRCALGLCKHTHHRVAAWAVIAIPMSIITVHLVG
jgi:hypothetical protein